jgi:hypothetical protein
LQAIAAVVGTLGSRGASAQREERPGPYAYILGIAPDQKLVGPSKLLQGVGVPNVSIRVYLRNVSYWLTRLDQSTVRLRKLKLYNPAIPSLVWDTDPNTRYPLIAVMYDGTVVNHANGSIDGLGFPNNAQLELFVWDPGELANRRQGFMLDIITLDGTLHVSVAPDNFYDRSLSD